MLDRFEIFLFKQIETCEELVRSMRNIFEILEFASICPTRIYFTDIDLCVYTCVYTYLSLHLIAQLDIVL